MANRTDNTHELFLKEVLDVIETERTIITDEIDAFETFLDAAESVAPRPEVGSGVPSVRLRSSGGDPIRSLRAAYKSTVMSVPHYETEYNEPFEKNICAEFGPDIATLLTTGRTFERYHKQAVITVTQKVIDRRQCLLDAVNNEQVSIERHREPVQSVIDAVEQLDSRTPTSEPPKLLDGHRKRIEVLESRCHDLIEQRQSEIVDDRRALSLSISDPDLPSYLYKDLSVTYPVVAPLTAALESVANIDAAVVADQSIRS